MIYRYKLNVRAHFQLNSGFPEQVLINTIFCILGIKDV